MLQREEVGRSPGEEVRRAPPRIGSGRGRSRMGKGATGMNRDVPAPETMALTDAMTELFREVATIMVRGARVSPVGVADSLRDVTGHLRRVASKEGTPQSAALVLIRIAGSIDADLPRIRKLVPGC